MKLLSIFTLLLGLSNAAKILVYSPKFAFSHMNFIGRVADTLQEAGHNVTVLQPIIRDELPGTGCKKATVLKVPCAETMEFFLKEQDGSQDLRPMMWRTSNFNPIGIVMAVSMVKQMFTLSLTNMLENVELVQQLKSDNYDIIIYELFDYTGFVVQHELGIKKAIGLQTTVIFDQISTVIGLPRAPPNVPDLFGIAPTDGTFIGRLLHYFYSYPTTYFEQGLMSVAREFLSKHYENAPLLEDMIANMSYIFTNSDSLLDFPRPTLHKVVDIGGIGVNQPKPLTKEWEDILSQRDTNILISFGSVAPSNLMPQESKESIVEMVKRFPEITFIWKYENASDGTGKGVDNLHLSKWTPQTDLLSSGKITLFVTHGGAGSVLESASAGVPTIAVPIFGDQMRNARMVERFGCSKMFNKARLADVEALTDVVRSSLNDKRLKERALLAQQLTKFRHFSPEELLIKHVDMALRFDDLSHLTPSARSFNVIQYYNLDVYVFLGAVSFLFLLVIYKAISRCVRVKEVKKKND